MQIRRIRNWSLLVLIGAMVAGCSGNPDAPPMDTDGPNQVVLKVPGMS